MIEDIESLPTLPIIASNILNELNNPNSSIKDIAAIIVRDQSISTKILKLVNSAFYGFPKRVGTISHAISILGFEAVRGLILGISLVDTFRIKEFDLTHFWKHSIQTASMASQVAKKIHYLRDDEAFTVGLIHDIGKLVLMLKKSEIYKQVLQEMKENKKSEIELERQYLHTDHALVGASLAKLWNFPLSYVDAIANHHQNTDIMKLQSLELIVNFSNRMVHFFEMESDDRTLPLSMIEKIALSPDECFDFLQSSLPEMDEFFTIIAA